MVVAIHNCDNRFRLKGRKRKADTPLFKIKNNNMETRNTFKGGIEPQKRTGETTEAKPKLNPPQFKEELINFHNPNIAWGMSLQKTTFKTFLR